MTLHSFGEAGHSDFCRSQVAAVAVAGARAVAMTMAGARAIAGAVAMAVKSRVQLLLPPPLFGQIVFGHRVLSPAVIRGLTFLEGNCIMLTCRDKSDQVD